MLASVRPSLALEVRCSGTRFRLSLHGPGGFQVRRARPSPFGPLGVVREGTELFANFLSTNLEREDSFRKQKEDNFSCAVCEIDAKFKRGAC